MQCPACPSSCASACWSGRLWNACRSGRRESEFERYVSETSSLWNMVEVKLDRLVRELSEDGDKSEILGSGTRRVCAEEKSPKLILCQE